jgi:ribonuclease J
MSRRVKIFLRESSELVNATVENYFTKDSFDWTELKTAVRDDLTKFLFEQTKRRPAILPVIMEVKMRLMNL